MSRKRRKKNRPRKRPLDKPLKRTPRESVKEVLNKEQPQKKVAENPGKIISHTRRKVSPLLILVALAGGLGAIVYISNNYILS